MNTFFNDRDTIENIVVAVPLIQNKIIKVKKRKCWNCHKPVENPENIYKFSCPHCKVTFSDKPLNEAKLHILQEDYLQTRSNVTLNKMMYLINSIIYNLICSALKRSGKFLDEEDIMDKVQWANLKMVYYFKKPEFKIENSFVSYLRQVVLYPLYNYKIKKKDINEISINTPIKGSYNSDDKEQTLLDMISSTPILDSNFEVENYFFKEIQKEETVDQVQDYINTVTKVANSKKGFAHALKILILYYHYLEKKPNKFFNAWWQTENSFELRDHFEKSLFILRNSLCDSSKG